MMPFWAYVSRGSCWTGTRFWPWPHLLRCPSGAPLNPASRQARSGLLNGRQDLLELVMAARCWPGLQLTTPNRLQGLADVVHTLHHRLDPPALQCSPQSTRSQKPAEWQDPLRDAARIGCLALLHDIELPGQLNRLVDLRSVNATHGQHLVAQNEPCTGVAPDIERRQILAIGEVK